ncbi:Homeobox protein CDX-1 [Lemmus lemmus]
MLVVGAAGQRGGSRAQHAPGTLWSPCTWAMCWTRTPPCTQAPPDPPASVWALRPTRPPPPPPPRVTRTRSRAPPPTWAAPFPAPKDDWAAAYGPGPAAPAASPAPLAFGPPPDFSPVQASPGPGPGLLAQSLGGLGAPSSPGAQRQTRYE